MRGDGGRGLRRFFMWRRVGNGECVRKWGEKEKGERKGRDEVWALWGLNAEFRKGRGWKWGIGNWGIEIEIFKEEMKKEEGENFIA